MTTTTAPHPPSATVQATDTAHVGVSVAADAVTVASLDVTADGHWRVGRYASLPLPEGAVVNGRLVDQDRVNRVLGATWRLSGVVAAPHTEIRVAVGGDGVTLTRRPDNDTRLPAAAWQLKMSARQTLAGTPKGSAFMVAPQETTAALRAVFANGGLDVVAVVPSGLAALYALPDTPEPTRAVLLVDGDQATCAIETDRRPSVVRTTTGCGHRVDPAALPRDPHVVAAVAEHALDCARRTALAQDGTPLRLWVGGAAARIPGLTRLLQDELQVPTTVLDPLEGHAGQAALTATQQRLLAPRLTVAVGAALVGVRGSKANLP